MKRETPLALFLCAAPVLVAAQTKAPYAFTYGYDETENIVSRNVVYYQGPQMKALFPTDSLSIEGYVGDGVRVYPNPTVGMINVEGANPDGKVPLTYSVYTMGSQLVATTRTHAASVRFDLTGYPKGMYLLKISGERGKGMEDN